MEISFKGKVALVTGAAMGMGLATARAFAKAGAAVAMADVDFERVTEEAGRLANEVFKTLAIKCDVMDESQVKSMVEKTVETFGCLDAAFNNAGIMFPMTDTADVDLKDYDRIMNINLRGVFICVKYELQIMRKQGNGAIVNNSSLGGLLGGAGRAAYHASKHGVPGLTKSAALEYAARNIRINAVCPGTIDTPMVQNMFAAGDLKKEDLSRLYPMARIGKASEVADAVLWLCSPMSSYVTGQAISVDGAYTIQ